MMLTLSMEVCGVVIIFSLDTDMNQTLELKHFLHYHNAFKKTQGCLLILFLVGV